MKKARILAIWVLALVVGLSVGVAKADFTFGTPINLGLIVNSSDVDWMPSLSADGLTLYFGSRRGGGFGAEDIYVTTRETTSDPWEEPLNLGPPVNTSNWEQGPSISADGLSLFFSSDRSGGVGPESLWVTTRETKNDPWGTPVNLGSKVNSSSVDWAPSISADGLELFFGSTRPGGYGGYDLWVTTRETIHDEWGSPVNLGGTVNSVHKTHGMSISHDGLLLFFSSNRPGGYGGFDFWVTRRKTINDPWSTPVNLGLPINSSEIYDQTPNISADGSTLYFTTERVGDIGEGDIYQSPVIPIVDLNADGIVDAADMCVMIDHWHTDETLCDIGPAPWGDGVVDFQDLAVLCEYWLADQRMVAHWKLDEAEGTTAHDRAGDKDGTLCGEPLWQADAGKIDGALQFDGIDDYISTDFALNPVEGSFSVLAWIKGGGPGQVIISQTDRQVGRSIQPGSTWLGLDQSDGGLVTTLMELSYPPLKSHVAINDGQWHQVGLVYDLDALSRRLYVDGVEVAKDTNLVGGVASSGFLYIGAGKTLDASSFFSGLMDDIRIYPVALTAKEIEELTR